MVRSSSVESRLPLCVGSIFNHINNATEIDKWACCRLQSDTANVVRDEKSNTLTVQTRTTDLNSNENERLRLLQ